VASSDRNAACCLAPVPSYLRKDRADFCRRIHSEGRWGLQPRPGAHPLVAYRVAAAPCPES